MAYRKRGRQSAETQAWNTIGKGLLIGGGTIAGGALGGIASTMGGPFAGLISGPLVGGGATIGGSLGAGISQIAGMGAYRVKANSLAAGIQEGVQVPRFSDAHHATIVRHREYIADIVSPGTAFTLQSFQVNPGLAASFPWLSGVAGNYDQYRILGMIFEFKTLFSDSYTGGALGSVVLASDYDTVDSNYPNKLEMENSEYCVSVKPSESVIHCIECDPSISFSPMKFIRTGGVPSGKDPRLYDHVNFQLAMNGIPASTSGSVIGELWVSYEIALYKPNLINSLDASPVVDHFTLLTTIAASGNHYLTPSTVTTAVAANAGSGIGGTILTGTYTLPPTVPIGTRVLFLYQVVGASTTLTSAISLGNGTSMGTGSTLDAGTYYQQVTAGAIATTQMVSEILTVTANVAAQMTMVLNGGTLPGGITSADLWVVLLPPAIT